MSDLQGVKGPASYFPSIEKAYGQPVYKLLGGGFNKRLRAYASSSASQ